MYVPKQCVKCDEGEYIEKEDITLLIIGSILLGIILIVVICIICGICAKKRNQNEKMKRLVSPNVNAITPTYRNMAFIDNLEGTTDSLEKYKRNPTLVTSSPMMPLPAAYQVNNINIATQPRILYTKEC